MNVCNILEYSEHVSLYVRHAAVSAENKRLRTIIIPVLI